MCLLFINYYPASELHFCMDPSNVPALVKMTGGKAYTACPGFSKYVEKKYSPFFTH